MFSLNLPLGNGSSHLGNSYFFLFSVSTKAGELTRRQEEEVHQKVRDGGRGGEGGGGPQEGERWRRRRLEPGLGAAAAGRAGCPLRGAAQGREGAGEGPQDRWAVQLYSWGVSVG